MHKVTTGQTIASSFCSDNLLPFIGQ